MKKVTTLILSLVATSCVAQKVDYFEVFNIDSTQVTMESFMDSLENRYSKLGEIESMYLTRDIETKSIYEFETVCINFVEFPYRWFCFTPEEIENTLENE